MANKKTFTLRLDAQLLRQLEKWAEREYRSVNGQIEWILRRALRKESKSQSKDEKAHARSNEA